MSGQQERASGVRLLPGGQWVDIGGGQLGITSQAVGDSGGGGVCRFIYRLVGCTQVAHNYSPTGGGSPRVVIEVWGRVVGFFFLKPHPTQVNLLATHPLAPHNYCPTYHPPGVVRISQHKRPGWWLFTIRASRVIAL